MCHEVFLHPINTSCVTFSEVVAVCPRGLKNQVLGEVASREDDNDTQHYGVGVCLLPGLRQDQVVPSVLLVFYCLFAILPTAQTQHFFFLTSCAVLRNLFISTCKACQREEGSDVGGRRS